MKRLIATALLCTVALTGCREERQAEETLIDSVTESSIVTTAEATEEKAEETTVVTEPVTENETADLTEQEKEQFRVVYTGYGARIFPLDNGIACSYAGDLVFVNTNKSEVESSVPVPEDFDWVSMIIKGDGDVLAKAICSEYDYSTTPPTYYTNAIIVNND